MNVCCCTHALPLANIWPQLNRREREARSIDPPEREALGHTTQRRLGGRAAEGDMETPRHPSMRKCRRRRQEVRQYSSTRVSDAAAKTILHTANGPDHAAPQAVDAV
jgi:hypothetical protein